MRLRPPKRGPSHRDRDNFFKPAGAKDSTPPLWRRPVPASRGIAVILIVAALIGGVVAASSGGKGTQRSPVIKGRSSQKSVSAHRSARRSNSPGRIVSGPPRTQQLSAHVAIGETVLRFIDPVRTISISGRVVARVVDTIIRFPVGASGPSPPDRLRARFRCVARAVLRTTRQLGEIRICGCSFGLSARERERSRRP